MPEFDIKQVESSTLYLKNVSKTFGGTKALRSVELKLMPGEIHGLLGQNGCGKSTLIKVLSGYHAPDAGGELWINGESVSLPIPPGGFTKYGMSFVHQDLGLVHDLTVLENLCIGKISTEDSWHINWKEEREKAVKIFEKYKINISPDAYVASLGPVEKAMLAIVRAVEDIHSNELAMKKKRGLLVLDEPTVFLPRTEVDVLFKLVRDVASEGISVLFVSHDIDEVKELTDVFTVFRDGMNVGSGVTAEFETDQIVEVILGQKLERYEVSTTIEEGDDIAADGAVIENLKGTLLKNASFTVHKGEVLGITGLVGSGFEEVPYLLFGADAKQSGTMTLGGKRFDLSKFNPTMAVKNRMALIPADRPNKGAVGNLLVKENMLMQVLHKFSPYCLNHKAMDKQCHKTVEDFDVRPRNIELNFSQLSGGNQQKVLMSKWILADCELMILHEPTQGVDIGARQQIYKQIENAAKAGTAVICCSSDYEQLEQICNRVIVLIRGEIARELRGSEITKTYLTQLCYETAL